MSLIIPTRRGFIAGLVGLVAAPAIIRVADLMPVKALPVEKPPDLFVPKPLRRWHHVVITRSDGVPAVFVDGKPVVAQARGGLLLITMDNGRSIRASMPPRGSHQLAWLREST